jgi:DNA-binding LytR/AlgR family response regulator
LIPEEVQFIKSDLEYTEIHISEKKYISSDSLVHWEGVLKNFGFIRVHKSFLLNADKIARVSGSQIFLKSGQSIPLGRAYKKEFDKQFLNK